VSAKGPTRAMILAAGLGTRMRPLTDDRPKPLIEVRGKTLIDHAIDRLVAAGVKLIVVNVHYRADMIRAHLARRKDVDIHISEEKNELLNTGGGIFNMLPHFENEPFFVHNSDSIWVEGYGHALDRLKQRWDGSRMDSLLLMASLVTAMGYEGPGDFMMDADGRLSRVPEKRISSFAYPGVLICNPRIFDGMKPGPFSINPLWDRAIEAGRLFGVRLDGVWIHVGTPEAVKEAEAFLADLEPV
jgi:MurNAc alpha-1-phosphate uridylyltransferase